jgi:RNAse (barnase) inhibitor barstar
MTTYEIDGNDFSTVDEFFDEISRVLILGARWGRNLDAFNDILRGGFGTPEDGFTLRWRNHAVSQQRLGYGETVRPQRGLAAHVVGEPEPRCRGTCGGSEDLRAPPSSTGSSKSSASMGPAVRRPKTGSNPSSCDHRLALTHLAADAGCAGVGSVAHGFKVGADRSHHGSA